MPINFDQPSVLWAIDHLLFYVVVSANLRRVSSFEALLSSTKYEILDSFTAWIVFVLFLCNKVNTSFSICEHFRLCKMPHYVSKYET
jgi:hypothetical protein